MAAATKRAAIQAANEIGKKVFAELVPAMAAEAKASPAAIKRSLIRKAASRRAARHGIAYKIRVRPGRAGQIPVKALKPKFARAEAGLAEGHPDVPADRRRGSDVRGRAPNRHRSGRFVWPGPNPEFEGAGDRRGSVQLPQNPAIEKIRKKVKPRFKRAFRKTPAGSENRAISRSATNCRRQPGRFAAIVEAMVEGDCEGEPASGPGRGKVRVGRHKKGR